jgi:hypothetical protein
MRATGPGQPALLLLDIFDILQELGVPSAIVGALAVSYYGVPRSTVDADAAIWLQGTGKNANDIQGAMVDAGYEARLSRGESDDPISAVLIIEDSLGNAVDLLIGVRGMDPNAVERCLTTPMLNSIVRVIGAEDLIAMKLFAGGPQDVMDVRGILQVWRERLDRNLLKKVTRLYGADVLETLKTLDKEPPLDG